MRRLSAAMVALSIGVAAALGPVRPATAVTPVLSILPILPDLRMAPLANFRVGSDPTLPGRTLLRFNTTIVNAGAAGGTFEVIGRRPGTSSATMGVGQVLHNGDGSTVTLPTTATMVFDDGDGHHHWHVRHLESYRLSTPNGGVVTSPKVGFCFYDNDAYDLSLPGAPSAPVFTGCGDQSSLTVDTGLSVGWGDTYPSDRYEQWVDITGLPGGVYRLTATADPNGYFTEASRTDNSTWADLRIDGGTVTALRYGP